MSDRGLRAIAGAGGSLLRHLSLFFRDTPKTPLRVLCIAALDTSHLLRHSKQMPRERVHALATFLDFGACTNAAWDHKRLCGDEYDAMRRRLDAAGLGAHVDEYLTRLHELESRRPSIGGDHRRFDEVRTYREAVVRISLATATAIAMNAASVEDELRATDRDSNFETLFRIVMQCQVIDDVLDYGEDRTAGLPSFLTSVASWRQAITMTAGAVRAYGGQWERSAQPSVWPLRLALRLVTALTSLIVHVASVPLLGYSWAESLHERSRLHPVQWWRARRRNGVRRGSRTPWRRGSEFHVREPQDGADARRPHAEPRRAAGG